MRRVRWSMRAILAVLALCSVLIGGVLTASAHAYIVRSDPQPGQVLRSAPHEVRLWFDEPVQAVFDALAVTDSQGRRVDLHDARIDPSNPTLLECDLPKGGLPDGLYSIAWRVISADGHPVSGVIPFEVRTAGGAVMPVHQNPVLTGYMPGPDMLFDRWLFYTGVLGFLGLVWYERWIAPPGLVQRRPRSVAWARWLTWLAALIGVLVSLPVQTRISAGVSWSQVWQPILLRATLNDTRFGHLWVVQLVLVVLLGNLIYLLSRVRWSAVAYTAVVLDLGLIVTKSLTSHAADTTLPVRSVVLDTVHMTAAGVWLGGLLGLVLHLPALRRGIRETEGELYWLALRRFTPWGLGSVAMLMLTGIYAAVTQIPTWYALEHSWYGRTLLVKLALFLIMLGFALYHCLRGEWEWSLGAEAYAQAESVSAPTRGADGETGETGAPASAAEHPRRGVRGTLWTEWAVGLVILLVTAVLTNLPPALAKPGPVRVAHSIGGGVMATLQITPNIAGQNQFKVDLTTSSGEPMKDIQQVTLTFTPLDMTMNMGQVTARLAEVRPGEYRATGLYLSMAGRWDVQLHVLTGSFQDLKADFSIRVGEAGA